MLGTKLVIFSLYLVASCNKPAALVDMPEAVATIKKGECFLDREIGSEKFNAKHELFAGAVRGYNTGLASECSRKLPNSQAN